jgi:hypothetical protein
MEQLSQRMNIRTGMKTDLNRDCSRGNGDEVSRRAVNVLVKRIGDKMGV